MSHMTPCPNCGGRNLYKSKKKISSGGGYAPNYLPGLGMFLYTARFRVVVCRDCGLSRFFADEEATAKLGESGKWTRVP